MSVTKCAKCRRYFDEEEIAWISVDDNHDAPYCVDCCPDDNLVNEDSAHEDEDE